MPFQILTGATGLLGRYLLRDGLVAGRRLAVLVRGNRRETATERVEGIVGHFEAELGRALPRPVVLDGNLHEGGLGLSDTDHRWIAEHCDSIIHSAASLSFNYEPETDEPFRTNVHGTTRLLNACESWNLQRFEYISTAYVAGTERVGQEAIVPEGRTFNNAYEQSKAQTERLVLERFDGQTRILRPSIIIGDSRTGHTSTFKAFYTPVQVMELLCRSQVVTDVSGGYEEIGIDPHAEKNVVPVDWVSGVMWRLIDSDQPHGSVFHVTNPQPITTRQIAEAFVPVLAELGLADGGESAPALKVSPQDVAAAIETYRPYLTTDPRFDCERTESAAAGRPCPVVDHEMLQVMIRYAMTTRYRDVIKDSPCGTSTVGQQLLGSLPFRDDTAPRVELNLTGPGGGHWGLATTNTGEVVMTRPAADASVPQFYGPAMHVESAMGHAIAIEFLIERRRLLLLGEHSSAAIAEGKAIVDQTLDVLRSSKLQPSSDAA